MVTAIGVKRMRLIDADALDVLNIIGGRMDGKVEFAKAVNEIIQNAPTVDAVPVIRCKDCVEFRRWDDECGECYDGLADGAMVSADGYCYAAERRKDAIQK